MTLSLTSMPSQNSRIGLQHKREVKGPTFEGRLPEFEDLPIGWLGQVSEALWVFPPMYKIRIMVLVQIF